MMKEQIEKMYIQALIDYLPPNVFADQVLRLFGVSKRHLIESILDDVKQSHSEYAVEKIERYLDHSC